jgi:hypothetical protein
MHEKNRAQWYLLIRQFNTVCVQHIKFNWSELFILRTAHASVLHELDVGQPKRNEIETLCEVDGGFHFRHLLL